MKIILVLLLVLVGCDQSSAPSGSAKDSRPVMVFAAASLRESLTEILEEWSKRTGHSYKTQFEATSILARQINDGAPADVFLSAAPEWLDKVKNLGHYDWLSNRLVLVVPRNAKDIDLKALESLALANEQVPAGKYAKAALAYLGIKLPVRTIYGSNVRDVLSMVSQGGAQAGIVYMTDAGVEPAVRITYTFPQESHPRILYSAGLLTPEGKAPFEALRERWAIEIAKKYGFGDVK